MVHPNFLHCGPATMFIYRNNENAKKVAIDDIITKFGRETTDMDN
jgi:hypothetical protein